MQSLVHQWDGMQALQWGVSFPDFAEHLVALVPTAKTAPWSHAINHAGRLALMQSRHLPSPVARWEAWVTVMSALASRSPSRLAVDVSGASEDGATNDTVAWIAEKARLMAMQAYDPLDWIYQSHAYDSHDVGTSPGFNGDTKKALASIRARTFIAVPEVDLYNPIEDGVWAAHQIPSAVLRRLPFDSGHLVASEAEPPAAVLLNIEIGRFLGGALDNESRASDV